MRGADVAETLRRSPVGDDGESVIDLFSTESEDPDRFGLPFAYHAGLQAIACWNRWGAISRSWKRCYVAPSTKRTAGISVPKTRARRSVEWMARTICEKSGERARMSVAKDAVYDEAHNLMPDISKARFPHLENGQIRTS